MHALSLLKLVIQSEDNPHSQKSRGGEVGLMSHALTHSARVFTPLYCHYKYLMAGSNDAALFTYRIDRYEGVVIELQDADLDLSEKEFERRLEGALRTWQEEGRRGVWLSIPIEASHLIPPAALLGFDFHHVNTEETLRQMEKSRKKRRRNNGKNGNNEQSGIKMRSSEKEGGRSENDSNEDAREEESRSSLTMVAWLPEEEPNTLPHKPHHQVGVGGMVLFAYPGAEMIGMGASKGGVEGERITKKEGEKEKTIDGVKGKGWYRYRGSIKILTIKEKRGATGIWKLPGGLADTGEDISRAVEREVKEETNIDAAFNAIAAIRETQAGPFGCADLYCVCALSLRGSDGGEMKDPPVPTPQEKEIAQCKWMELADFLSLPYYQTGVFGSQGALKYAVQTALHNLIFADRRESRKKPEKPSIREGGMMETRMDAVYRPGKETLYYSKI